MDPELLYYNRVLSISNIVIGLIGLPLTILITIAIIRLLKSNPNIDLRLYLIVIVLDFITCIVLVPTSIINLLNPEVLHNKFLCQVDYFFFIGSVFLSVWILAIVSIERVIVIIFHRKPSWYFLKGLISLFVGFYIFTFIYGLVTDTIKPSRLWNYCFVIAANESRAGGVILSTICILSAITILIVIVCYTAIAIYVFKASLDIRNKSFSYSEYPQQPSKNIKKAFLRMIITVLMYILTNSFEIGLELREVVILKERTLLEETICSIMQFFNVMVNSSLILFSNEQVNNSFLKLIGYS